MRSVHVGIVVGSTREYTNANCVRLKVLPASV